MAADNGAFDDDGLEAFGSGIDGGAESGGTGAVDSDVIFGTRGIAKPAELLDDLAIGGTLEARAIGKDAQGQAAIARTGDIELATEFIGGDFRPFERDIGAMKEIADGVSAATFVAAVDLNGSRRAGG